MDRADHVSFAPLAERIRNSSDTLTPAQRDVVRYMEANLQQCLFLSATDLAVRVGTSQATVIRTARKLGFSGFSEWQEALRRESVVGAAISHLDQATGAEGIDSSISTVVNQEIENLRSLSESIDNEKMNAIVRAILGAKDIYFAGYRSSAGAAAFGAMSFRVMLGAESPVYELAGNYVEEMLRINEDSVVIGISFPRYSNVTLKILQMARRRNAKIIGITDSEASPVAPLSTVCCAIRATSPLFVDSIVPVIALLESICLAVAQAAPERTRTGLASWLNSVQEAGVHYEKSVPTYLAQRHPLLTD